MTPLADVAALFALAVVGITLAASARPIFNRFMSAARAAEQEGSE
jgi:hypothetical protein